MLGNIAFEATVILLLILFNGFLAMSELAIVSARKTRLQQLAAKGDAGARAALNLSESPSDFLAAVQIGITLVGILAGAFGGASIAGVLAAELREVGLGRFADGLALAAVVLVVSFLSLVVGELVPKRLALAHAERLSRLVSRPIRGISFLATPAVRVLSFCTETIVKLIGLKTSDEPPVTEEEVKIMIEQGTAAGVFERGEETMMKRVLRLGDRSVGSIMTQRLEVVFLDLEATFQENLERILATPHSYYPIFRESQDDIVGMVLVKDIMARLAELRVGGQANGSADVDIAKLMKEPLFVAESMPTLSLLESFKRAGQQIAIVVDEYGGTAGLVTLTDVLEAIAGDLTPGAEDDVEGVSVRADGSILVDGTKPFEELADMLALDVAEEADAGDYQSVGGFVMHQMRAIPREGQTFTWRDYRFEVVDMDGHRVDKVLVVPPPKPERPPELEPRA